MDTAEHATELAGLPTEAQTAVLADGEGEAETTTARDNETGWCAFKYK